MHHYCYFIFLLFKVLHYYLQTILLIFCFVYIFIVQRSAKKRSFENGKQRKDIAFALRRILIWQFFLPGRGKKLNGCLIIFFLIFCFFVEQKKEELRATSSKLDLIIVLYKFLCFQSSLYTTRCTNKDGCQVDGTSRFAFGSSSPGSQGCL